MANQFRGIKLGTIRGAQIIVQPSTLLMILVLAVFYSGGGTQRGDNAFSRGVLMAVLLFVSVFIHEFAHAVAAWSFGRKVSTIVLTLWGGHTTFDARNLTPKVVAVTAVAGPAANAVVAVVAQAAVASGIFEGPTLGIVSWLVWANLLLAIFNLLPGIPLDGGKVTAGVVWAVTGDRIKGTYVAAWVGRFIAVGVAVFAVAWPLSQGRNVGLIDLAFGVLLFSVIWPAASATIKHVKMQSRRESATVTALMRPAIGVPYTDTVAAARAAALAKGVVEIVILTADGEPAGITSLPVVDRVPEQQRAVEGLQSVTSTIPRGAVVDVRIEGEELVQALREWYGRTDAWAVMSDETVVGVLRLEELVAAYQ